MHKLAIMFIVVLAACGGEKREEGYRAKRRGGSCEQLAKCCDALPDDYDSSGAKRACSEPREQDLICWVHLSDVRQSFSITSYEKWPMPAACKGKKKQS